MILHTIQRTGTVASLIAAMAMALPVGSVMAAPIPGSPAQIAVLPELAAPVETAAAALSDDGAIQVAQSRRQLERRNRALRHDNRDLRHRNRNLARRDRIYRNDRWYYRRGDRYYDNTGAVLAGVIVGGAAAALAGSALAASSQPRVVIEQPAYGIARPYSAEWYRQCDLKYNSFRASDGTYLGYDGYRHTCRLP